LTFFNIVNVSRNDTGDVELRTVDTLDAVTPPWDFVVANINPVVVAQEAAKVVALLAPGGTYVCTGIPIEREDAVLEALSEAGFDGIVPRPSGEWIGFVREFSSMTVRSPMTPRP